jgi:hypothetical protein
MFIIEYLNNDGSVRSAHIITEAEMVDLLHNRKAHKPSEAYYIE